VALLHCAKHSPPKHRAPPQFGPGPFFIQDGRIPSAWFEQMLIGDPEGLWAHRSWLDLENRS
jgi:hypothetical protein